MNGLVWWVQVKFLTGWVTVGAFLTRFDAEKYLRSRQRRKDDVRLEFVESAR
jgi:hypothetical protein